MSDSIFRDITLEWEGETFTVPADKGLRLAEKVELALRSDSGLSVFELVLNPPITTLSRAYGAALRFAGCRVTDEAVYHAVTKVITGSEDEALAARAMIDQVLGVLLPPDDIKSAPTPKGGKSGKKTTGG